MVVNNCNLVSVRQIITLYYRNVSSFLNFLVVHFSNCRHLHVDPLSLPWAVTSLMEAPEVDFLIHLQCKQFYLLLQEKDGYAGST